MELIVTKITPRIANWPALSKKNDQTKKNDIGNVFFIEMKIFYP
jgi:hypothetical protein